MGATQAEEKKNLTYEDIEKGRQVSQNKAIEAQQAAIDENTNEIVAALTANRDNLYGESGSVAQALNKVAEAYKAREASLGTSLSGVNTEIGTAESDDKDAKEQERKGLMWLGIAEGAANLVNMMGVAAGGNSMRIKSQVPDWMAKADQNARERKKNIESLKTKRDAIQQQIDAIKLAAAQAEGSGMLDIAKGKAGYDEKIAEAKGKGATQKASLGFDAAVNNATGMANARIKDKVNEDESEAAQTKAAIDHAKNNVEIYLSDNEIATIDRNTLSSNMLTAFDGVAIKDEDKAGISKIYERMTAEDNARISADEAAKQLLPYLKKYPQAASKIRNLSKSSRKMTVANGVSAGVFDGGDDASFAAAFGSQGANNLPGGFLWNGTERISK